jgi:Ca2+-binding EF-hand superfamily protein
MTRCLFAAAALAVGFVTVYFATAADKPEVKPLPPFLVESLKGSAEDFIKRFDKNKDGYLTKDELPPRLAQAFDRFDRNGDGKLDKQEVEQMLQMLRKRFGIEKNEPVAAGPEVDRIVARMLERMDTDKDGRISRAEAKGPLAENFDRWDTNKDGYLDKDELRRVAARFLANRGGGPERPGERTAAAGPDFDALDLNADGRLTRDELKGTPYFDHFDEIDTNKDGKIDRKEFEAYLKKQAAKKGS